MRNPGYTWLFALVLLLAGLADAVAAKRIALVVGNDDYTSLPKLQKAVNDAQAVSRALQDIGFEVISGENLSRRQMNRKFASLMGMIKPGDQVFFFFAGHGVALGEENYLIPSDMPKPGAGQESLVRDEGYAVSRLVNRVRAQGASSTIFVLDACRDNPFKSVGVRSIGSARGFTRMEAPNGVFLLFSAGIGQKALDRLPGTDTHPNSVFTRKLVPLLLTPGLTHVGLAKQVQQDVDALARRVGHAQQPAYYDQIIGNIVLRPGKPQRQKEKPAAPLSVAAQIWAVTKDTKSVAVLQAFIRKFPDSVFADLAKARVTELTALLNPAANTPPVRKEPVRTEVPAVRPAAPNAKAQTGGRTVGQTPFTWVRMAAANLCSARCDHESICVGWEYKSDRECVLYRSARTPRTVLRRPATKDVAKPANSGSSRLTPQETGVSDEVKPEKGGRTDGQNAFVWVRMAQSSQCSARCSRERGCIGWEYKKDRECVLYRQRR